MIGRSPIFVWLDASLLYSGIYGGDKAILNATLNQIVFRRFRDCMIERVISANYVSLKQIIEHRFEDVFLFPERNKPSRFLPLFTGIGGFGLGVTLRPKTEAEDRVPESGGLLYVVSGQLTQELVHSILTLPPKLRTVSEGQAPS